MPGIGRMDRDGAVVEYTAQGSQIRWRMIEIGAGDTPETILASVLARLRALNDKDAPTKAREVSLAITKCEEAAHWLRALDERRREQRSI
jgi:hypothetical protein